MNLQKQIISLTYPIGQGHGQRFNVSSNIAKLPLFSGLSESVRSLHSSPSYNWLIIFLLLTGWLQYDTWQTFGVRNFLHFLRIRNKVQILLFLLVCSFECFNWFLCFCNPPWSQCYLVLWGNENKKNIWPCRRKIINP